MTIIPFPSERELLERRVRELGGVVIWAPVALTPRQREILAFVRSLQRDLQGPVTTEVIAGEFCITPGTVRNHMKPLASAKLVFHPVGENGKVHRCSGWHAVPEKTEQALAAAA